MPLPLIAAGVAAAASAISAISTGTVVAATAAATATAVGVGVYKDSKHKEEVATLQDKINELQKCLNESRDKEKNLILKIEKLQKEKNDLLLKVTKLNNDILKLKQEETIITERLAQNNIKMKNFFNKLIGKAKKLEAENYLLKQELDGYMTEAKKYKQQLIASEQNVVRLDTYHKELLTNLNSTRNDINSLTSELKTLEAL